MTATDPVRPSRATRWWRELSGRNPLRQAWLDLTDVPHAQRIATRAVYAAIAIVLVVMLVVEHLSQDGASSTAERWGAAAQSLAFGLGWGLVIAAGILARRRILLPILAVFLVINLPRLLSLAGLFVLLVIASAVALWFLVRRAPLRDNATGPVLAVVVPVVLCLLMTLTAGAFESGLSQGLLGLAMYPVLLLVWGLAGIAVVDTATDLTRWLSRLLARSFAPGALGAVVVLVVVARILLGLLIAFTLYALLDPQPGEELETAHLAALSMGVSELLVGVPVLLTLLVLALGRRWNPRALLTVLALSIVVPLLIGLFIVSLSGWDLTDAVGSGLQATGLVPPFLLFALTLAFSLLSLGSGFAASDGPVLPRGARIYLTLGLVLLALNFAFIIMVSELASGSESALGSLQAALLPFSLLVIGAPYLLYLLVKRRTKLIGDAPEQVAVTSRWPAWDRADPRVLTLVFAGVGLLAIVAVLVIADLVMPS